MKKKTIIILSSIIGFILLVVIAFFIYVGSYYRADSSVEVFLTNSETVIVETKDDYFVFEGSNATKGFVFYPGGLVEAISYAPLMYELAARGYLCILLEVPFNLAIFDTNAAKGVIDDYEYIEEWYIGGHSLGGTCAGMYLEKNHELYDGLILLGSYVTTDLSETDMKVLSIYGENDQVLNMEAYKENASNLPSNYKEEIIDGGCHAYFGSYGNQKGDGTPTISNAEQILKTVELICNFSQ